MFEKHPCPISLLELRLLKHEPLSIIDERSEDLRITKVHILQRSIRRYAIFFKLFSSFALTQPLLPLNSTFLEAYEKMRLLFILMGQCHQASQKDQKRMRLTPEEDLRLVRAHETLMNWYETIVNTTTIDVKYKTRDSRGKSIAISGSKSEIKLGQLCTFFPLSFRPKEYKYAYYFSPQLRWLRKRAQRIHNSMDSKKNQCKTAPKL